VKTDAVTGLALIAAGAAVAWEARDFPRLGGMDYGPDLFPTIAAAGMAGCGALILLGAVLRPAGAEPAPRERARWPALALLGVVALFALALRPVGFHLSAAGATLAAALLFGARPLAGVVMAVVLPVALHAVFYTVLRVPLPWGVLTPVAW
jgi:putative tricarboxylic transport membrane protein